MSTIRLRGPKAIVAAIIFLVVGGSRVLMPTTAVDERAAEPVRQWLALEIGGEIGQQLDNLDPKTITAAQVNELTAQATAMNQIEIIDLAGRRAGKDRMIVRAEFRAGTGAATQTVYLEMRTRTIGRWEVRRESSVWRWRTSVLGGL